MSKGEVVEEKEGRKRRRYVKVNEVMNVAAEIQIEEGVKRGKRQGRERGEAEG